MFWLNFYSRYSILIDPKLTALQVVAEEQAGEAEAEGETDNITRIFFDPGHYSVMENCGSFMVTVTREGT